MAGAGDGGAATVAVGGGGSGGGVGSLSQGACMGSCNSMCTAVECARGAVVLTPQQGSASDAQHSSDETQVRCSSLLLLLQLLLTPFRRSDRLGATAGGAEWGAPSSVRPGRHRGCRRARAATVAKPPAGHVRVGERASEFFLSSFTATLYNTSDCSTSIQY